MIENFIEIGERTLINLTEIMYTEIDSINEEEFNITMKNGRVFCCANLDVYNEIKDNVLS